jgi:hypothetical protein
MLILPRKQYRLNKRNILLMKGLHTVRYHCSFVS